MYNKPDYTVSVPVINGCFKRQGREAVVGELKKLGANRVFLARGIYTTDTGKFCRMLDELRDNCAYLKENGFEVGVWGWSFIIEGEADSFTRIRSLDGKSTDKTYRCPLDPEFREFVGNYAAELAKTGVDIILFDDDYNLAFWRGNIACGCELHMARVKEILGEEITNEDFKAKVLRGGNNKYRDTYLAVNREALEGFACHIRASVDKVNPNVRIGVCSCMNWDADGISPAEISRAFAGNTKPLLRLIGATYWPTQPRWSIYNRLGAVIEFERMERSWCEDDIEIMAEGDVYPRPRYAVPSSYLELFDTALMADGGMNGILKYALDYTADPSYERGYVDAHCRNNPVRAQIREKFSAKEACGMRIYEKMRKFQDMEIPEELSGNDSVVNIFYSPAAKMLSSLSIPSTYHGMGTCGVVFGENARGLEPEALKNGLILDLTAAKILQATGIDTGIVRIGDSIKPEEEFFVADDTYVAAGFKGYNVEIDANAKTESYFLYTDKGEKRRAPGSYYYENAQGNRFLVLAFDMHFNIDTCFRSYTRAAQMIRASEYLSGQKLPASIKDCPDLYMMCKRDDGGALAVGLWNIFADPVYEPVITLDREYSDIQFINCTGRLERDKVCLSPISAFTFAGFEVK